MLYRYDRSARGLGKSRTSEDAPINKHASSDECRRREGRACAVHGTGRLSNPSRYTPQTCALPIEIAVPTFVH